MALHEQAVGATDEWYTPPYVFAAMRTVFDLDVASPGKSVTPWIPANNFYTESSLERDWSGFVWMNPPFGKRNGLVPWLEKFFEHGDGIALVPDRTSAPWWQQFAPKSNIVLFVAPKIKFIGVNGNEGDSPAQGTCLLGVGGKATSALDNASARLGALFAPCKEAA
jgi:hypothetical protein